MSDQALEDEWALGGGLPLDGAEVEITGFEFGFNNDYSAGVLAAIITFTPLDGSDEQEQTYSVGQGWEQASKGAELVSENGKPKKLSQRSGYGMFVAAAVDAVNGDFEKLGKGFRFADSWIGTRWELGSIEVETANPNDKENTKKRDRIVPVKFLGRDGEAKTSTGSKASTAKTDDESDELVEQLVEMAKAADDHESFMDEALELKGVAGNKALEKKVMSTGRGSIWKLAER